MLRFFTTSWVATALNINSNSASQPLNFITTDTREVKTGDLFVALKGESSDGHLFIDKAIASGARAVVVRKDYAVPPGVEVYRVDDTLVAYRLLAMAWRREFVLPVIAVAGSAGKTTTKEMITAILRGKYKNVLSTQASQNGYQGIPATLLRLRPAHDAAVIEVGIDECDAMKSHLEIVTPDYGILSSIGEEHLEKLIDLDTVEKEEGLLFGALALRNGLGIVNLDDARIDRQAQLRPSLKKITYSLQKPADICGSSAFCESLWSLVLQKPFVDKINCPLPGNHNAANLLGAVATGCALGLNKEQILAGLKTFAPPPGRSNLIEWKGVKILADMYNANPPSVIAAIQTLPESRRKFLALGDMLELGTQEESLHRSLAETILKNKVTGVYLYGERMKSLADELKRRSYPGSSEHFAQATELARALTSTLQPGDSLLIKGSRGMKMETVLEEIQKS